MRMLEDTLKSWRLDYLSIGQLMEAVNALDRYELLPETLKASMQDICNQYKVILAFGMKRNKLFLTGITDAVTRDTFLHPDDPVKFAKLNKLLENCKEYWLYPYSNNELVYKGKRNC